MSNGHLHPIFQHALSAFAPPDDRDDGQQQSQAWLSPIEHLEAGGYMHEAKLMGEALQSLREYDCLMTDLGIAAHHSPRRETINLIERLEGRK